MFNIAALLEVLFALALFAGLVTTVVNLIRTKMEMRKEDSAYRARYIACEPHRIAASDYWRRMGEARKRGDNAAAADYLRQYERAAALGSPR